MARNEEMLNNEKYHDVVFSVGKSREKMYGHSILLNYYSEHFNNSLTSGLAESIKNEYGKHEIEIPDFEPKIFLEILRYIYCKTANITTENFWEIYKAVDKYRMKDLENSCFRFLNAKNVTKILGEIASIKNKCYYEHTKEACMNVIYKNPISFFEDENFANVDIEYLKLFCEKLVKFSNPYCSNYYVVSAINKWFKKNKDNNTISKKEIETLKKSIEINIKKIHFGRKQVREDNLYFSSLTKLTVLNPCTLFGFGIHQKEIEDYCNDKGYNYKGKLKIEIKIFSTKLKEDKLENVIKVKVPTIDCGAPIQDIYIEKINLDKLQSIEFKLINADCSESLFDQYVVNGDVLNLYKNDFFDQKSAQNFLLASLQIEYNDLPNKCSPKAAKRQKME